MPVSLKQLGLSAGLAIATIGAPAVAAASTTAPVQAQAQAAPAQDEATTAEDSASYEAREARDPDLAKFAGGDRIVIGSTVLVAALVVLLLVLLL